MPVPAPVIARLQTTYPKPTIDPAWLEACYEWVIGEFNLRDDQVDEIFARVENQLMDSDLDDSMQHQTGIPPNVNDLHDVRIASGPRGAILCQIVALTDIGQSAFSLQNVRQTRIDRADLAGLVEAGVEDEEENQPVPKYPRGTLRMDLSDGSMVLRAMEYKRLPGLELGVTPLGCKVLLKNVLIRRGIAFLEPATVDIYVGSQTEEREAVQDRDFARGLRVRLGKPEIDSEEEERQQGPPPGNPPAPPPPPAPTAHAAAPRNVSSPRPSPTPPPAGQPPNQEPEGGAADDSFDYFPDDDDEFNEDYFRHLDEVEAKYVVVKPESPLKPESSSSARKPTTATAAGGEGGSKAMPASKPGANSRGTIIEIDSSEDDAMDTQATVVASRPPTARKPPRRPVKTNTDEIIEISD